MTSQGVASGKPNHHEDMHGLKRRDNNNRRFANPINNIHECCRYYTPKENSYFLVLIIPHELPLFALSHCPLV
jgi:hypothetical protein